MENQVLKTFEHIWKHGKGYWVLLQGDSGSDYLLVYHLALGSVSLIEDNKVATILKNKMIECGFPIVKQKDLPKPFLMEVADEIRASGLTDEEEERKLDALKRKYRLK